MKRLLLLALCAAACSSTTLPVATGNFIGPVGLAATSAGDRDLLFITSTGSDELRALQICNTPPLADGGVDPANTCPSNEDFQFVPGPIRVFAATVQTGDRPLRLAGARLLRPDNTKAGVALAVGADDTVRVVDALNLVEAMNHKAAAKAALTLPVDAPPVDVVASNALDPATGAEVNSASVKAFVALQASTTVPPQLLVLDVKLGADGAAQLPTVVQRCSLGAVQPRRLALVPGNGGAVYVADGAGDGAVRIDVASIPAAADPLSACTVAQRLPAGGPARALALSPAWYEDGHPDHPAGELALIVRDDGGAVFTRTADATIVPIPPSDYRGTGPAMEPLQAGGFGRDATFLSAIKPRPDGCIKAPCTPLLIGQVGVSSLHTFNLLAMISGQDGGGYFVDVQGRRFINENYYGGDPTTLQPIVDTAPTISPAQSSTAAAPVTFAPADGQAGHQNAGWFNSGVTRKGRWRMTWHSAIPGLERRGGTVTHGANGNLLFKVPQADLASYQSDPILKLGAGDVVSFAAYYVADGSPAECDELTSEVALRFELPIVSVTADTLELAPLAAVGSSAAFNPACPRFGAVAEIRTAGAKPWLVIEGNDLRQRAATGELIIARGSRFDYPLDYDPSVQPLTPTTDTDISAAFTITADEPTVPGTLISFTVTSGQIPTAIRDTTATQGLATTVLSYTSPRLTNLMFMALTGSNTLLQATPEALTNQGGILAYR